MARSVVIDSGPIVAENRARELSRDQWSSLVSTRKTFLGTNLPYDCRCLVRFVNEAEDMWEPLGYQSLDDLLRRGYGIDPQEARMAADWLALREPAAAVSLPEVLKLARHGTNQYTREVSLPDVLRRHGRGHDNVISSQGNSAAYLKARLARDRPDLLARVTAGELTAHGAAVVAGWKKRPTPLEVIVRNLPKLSADERRRLAEMLL